MLINGIISIVAILVLGFIEWCLLQHGIDGTIALIIVAAIAGIAGFNVKEIMSFVRGKDKGGK
jgi:Mg2+/citrate symporter